VLDHEAVAASGIVEDLAGDRQRDVSLWRRRRNLVELGPDGPHQRFHVWQLLVLERGRAELQRIEFGEAIEIGAFETGGILAGIAHGAQPVALVRRETRRTAP